MKSGLNEVESGLSTVRPVINGAARARITMYGIYSEEPTVEELDSQILNLNAGISAGEAIELAQRHKLIVDRSSIAESMKRIIATPDGIKAADKRTISLVRSLKPEVRLSLLGGTLRIDGVLGGITNLPPPVKPL